MHSSIRTLAAVIILLTGASVTRAADESYAIKLHRPSKAGDVYDTKISIENTRSIVSKPPNGPAQEQKETVAGDISGRVRVTAVDAKGEPSQFSITVTKFTFGPAAREVVPKGKVIEVTRDEKEVTCKLSDGSEISPDAMAVLQAFYSPISKDAPNDDQVFGSKIPRRVGESWPLDANQLARDVVAKGGKLDPKHASGTFKLKAIEDSPSGKAMRIEGSAEMKNLMLGEMPPGTTVTESQTKLQVSGLFPLDPEKQELESISVMDVKIKMIGTNSATVEVVGHGFKKTISTPVAK